MNEFDEVNPLAWEQDGIVLPIPARKPPRSRVRRQLTWAIATTLVGASSSLAATSVSVAAFGGVSDVLHSAKANSDPDLVPLGFWNQLTSALKRLPTAAEPEGPDPDYFV